MEIKKDFLPVQMVVHIHFNFFYSVLLYSNPQERTQIIQKAIASYKYIE